jgi:hypothetical protein
MTRPIVAVLLGVAAVVLAIVVYVVTIVSKGELGEKRGWALLQSTELKHRRDPNTQTPILLFNPMESKYVVLGVPTEDTKFPRAWIILNETTPSSSVYILPQNQRSQISCSYVDEVSSKVKMPPPVLELLRAKCSAQTGQ